MSSSQTIELLLENDGPLSSSSEWNDWRWQLRNAISKIEDLAKMFLFDKIELENLLKVIEKYPIAITPYYLLLINRENP